MKSPTRLSRHIPAYVAALVILAAFFILGTGTAAAQTGCTVTVGDGQINRTTGAIPRIPPLPPLAAVALAAQGD